MIKFIDGYKIYKEDELIFKDIEDAFDLRDVLNEQQGDARWEYIETEGEDE